MKTNYISRKGELDYERSLYSEELGKSDWKYLKEASEIFLIHAYKHLFKKPQTYILGDFNYSTTYSQFYLNLGVGLEILLKSALLKNGIKINSELKNNKSLNLDPAKTIGLGIIIDKHLSNILKGLCQETLEEIKCILKIINLRRNNLAHCFKKTLDSVADEYVFSYITLYIYQKCFNDENTELIKLLLKSISRSKTTQNSTCYKRLRIKPKALRKNNELF